VGVACGAGWLDGTAEGDFGGWAAMRAQPAD